MQAVFLNMLLETKANILVLVPFWGRKPLEKGFVTDNFGLKSNET